MGLLEKMHQKGKRRESGCTEVEGVTYFCVGKPGGCYISVSCITSSSDCVARGSAKVPRRVRCMMSLPVAGPSRLAAATATRTKRRLSFARSKTDINLVARQRVFFDDDAALAHAHVVFDTSHFAQSVSNSEVSQSASSGVFWSDASPCPLCEGLRRGALSKPSNSAGDG